MGTNYYLKLPDEEEHLHIGKSSAGWVFALHIYPEKGINDLIDWIEWFDKGVIYDEYLRELSAREMVVKITQRNGPEWDESYWTYGGRYKDEEDFHRKNGSERGPNNLLRSRIGEWCVKHGTGTWECIVGDFS